MALSQLLLQFFLFALTVAQPIAIETTQENAWKYGTGGGVIGFAVLILDIIVFVEVLKSNRPPVHKLLWLLLVFLFPIGGLIIYWLFSNRAAHNTGSGYETIG
jgi:hypothetical protein